MMKKPALGLFGAVILAAMITLGMQRPPAQTATKAQVQASTDDNAVREAAQNRLCEGLKVVQAKLGQLEKSVSAATGFHNDFKVIVGRIKTEKLTPLFEKRTIETKKTAQVKTGLVPVEQTRKLTQVYGQLRGVKNDLTRIRGTLQAQIADLEKSWGVIDRDLKRVAGLRPVAGTSPSRQCVVQEANRVQGEMAALGTQASALQAEIEDVNAALDQEFGQGPCSDGAISGNGDCESCCAQYYPITAPEGSAEYSQQQWARFQCQVRCAAAAARATILGAKDEAVGTIRDGAKSSVSEARDLFKLASKLLKDIEERRSGTVANLTRI